MDFEEYLIRFSDPSVRIGKKCPNCGSSRVVFLQYGLGWDEEYQPLIDAGEIIPMGCVMGDENLACRECEHCWKELKED